MIRNWLQIHSISQTNDGDCVIVGTVCTYDKESKKTWLRMLLRYQYYNDSMAKLITHLFRQTLQEYICNFSESSTHFVERNMVSIQRRDDGSKLF